MDPTGDRYQDRKSVVDQGGLVRLESPTRHVHFLDFTLRRGDVSIVTDSV